MIEEYPKHSEDSSLFAPKQDRPEESTKITDHQPTSNLISRLRTTIDQYQPHFRPKANFDKVNFNQLDLNELAVEDQQLPVAEDTVKQEISSAVMKQRLVVTNQ